MTTRRPLALLVNPVAGRKLASGPPLATDDELAPEALSKALIARGLDVTLRVLAESDDPAEVARAAIDGGADVVVSGGDGTVGRVASAVAAREATLGIIATGSFNNIARGIGLPDSLAAALDVIAAGATTAIDVGAVARDGQPDELFFEAAGVGIDAAGFGAVEVTARRGVWRGLRALWRAVRWQRRRMIVQLDGGRTLRTAALVVTVSNGPYYGFGFTVAESADIQDGLFEVSIFRRMSKLDLIRHFAAVARGRRQYEPRIRSERAARVRIAGAHRALPVHADGQSIGTTPVVFEVRANALRVFR